MPTAKVNPYQKLSIRMTFLFLVRKSEPTCHIAKPVRIGLTKRLIP